MRMGAGVYVWLKLGMAIAVLWYSCTAAAQKSGCGDSCQTLNDCPGQLVCVDGKCTDDPDVGSHVCSDPGSGSGNGNCKASGHLTGRTGKCNRQHDSDCCVAGKEYPQYHCSPSISDNTPATMTINSFAKGGDGGGASECDGRFHDDDEMVVALSTGWYNGGSRCLNNIRITANGVTVQAMVVDECDSVNGCDSDHDFQPPCPNNVVDASPAVWDALGIHGSDVGDYEITWSDAS